MTDLTKNTIAPQFDEDSNFAWLRKVYDSSIISFKDAVVIDGTTDFKTNKLFPEMKVRLFKGSYCNLTPFQPLTELAQFFLFAGLIGGIFGLGITFLFGIGVLETVLVILGLAAVYFMGTAATDVIRRTIAQLVPEKERLLDLVPLLDHPSVEFKAHNLRKFKLTAIHLKRGITVQDSDLFELGLSVLCAYQQIHGDTVEIDFRKTFHDQEPT